MKAQTLLLLVAAALLGAIGLEAAPQRTRTVSVTGTIYNDTNRNNRLDRGERSGQHATVWLYRVRPNGTRLRVGRVKVNKDGQYLFDRINPGKYLISVQFSANKFAVRTRAFNVSALARGEVRNIPFVNRQTVKHYPSLSPTPNPANLHTQPTVSKFAP